MGLKESENLPRPPEYDLVHRHVQAAVMRDKDRLLAQMIDMRTERLLHTLQTTKLAEGLSKVETQLKIQDVMKEHGLFGLYMLFYSAFGYPQNGSAESFKATGLVTDPIRVLTDGQAAQRTVTRSDILGEYESSVTYGSRLHWLPDDRIMLERVSVPRPGYQATIGDVQVYPDDELVPGDSITFAPIDLAHTVRARRRKFTIELEEALVFNLPDRRHEQGMLVVPIDEMTIYDHGYIPEEKSEKIISTLQRFRLLEPER